MDLINYLIVGTNILDYWFGKFVILSLLYFIYRLVLLCESTIWNFTREDIRLKRKEDG